MYIILPVFTSFADPFGHLQIHTCYSVEAMTFSYIWLVIQERQPLYSNKEASAEESVQTDRGFHRTAGCSLNFHLICDLIKSKFYSTYKQLTGNSLN